MHLGLVSCRLWYRDLHSDYRRSQYRSSSPRTGRPYSLRPHRHICHRMTRFDCPSWKHCASFQWLFGLPGSWLLWPVRIDWDGLLCCTTTTLWTRCCFFKESSHFRHPGYCFGPGRLIQRQLLEIAGHSLQRLHVSPYLWRDYWGQWMHYYLAVWLSDF